MSPQWIVVIGLIVVVYFLFIKKKPAVTKSDKQNKDEVQSNDMVECSTCGVYCELDDAILSNNKYYCSDECLEKK
ncbi:MAG: PP0621 family protein [Sulfurimonas sp.]|nr:PP0621 family protein [Sulfurimonas sp.]